MIEIANNVGPSKLDIAYERLGDPSAPPVLLIMGLGAQLIAWPDGFCDALVERGLHVIRFDNRDVGQSSHFEGKPNFPAVLAGDFATVVYTLSDMAADTAGLLDVLGLTSVHVVGASMGGFIGQMLAIEHPARVRSLTSIMSTTGNIAVGFPHPAALGLFTGAPPTTREEAIERAMQASAVLSSPGYPPDPAFIRERTARSYDRWFDPLSFARQGAAVIASGDRTARLRNVHVPTLVIHGKADQMVDVSGGRATAAAIPGAELVEIDGMGHDLPRALWADFVARIAALIARAK